MGFLGLGPHKDIFHGIKAQRKWLALEREIEGRKHRRWTEVEGA